ncbi:DUF2752 domain-containing protein [Cellulophaga lytica]|uniref:DUF2752 domain-containing protein n=2 Tax=Cellulophaga lytica TaxID=979 RepID=F0RFC0_CELLC|nr:DUF2752 domain-containing protein [Cellulophaga lytica]ADY27862.1 hypothetical protein Celly_0027 [Cellulophaga lytica DSM 7489]AIM62108.1 hypothetical protein IX49_16840 [Cellulophaga lytica]MDO6853013.1 DUF2752 domain-containing protein [Cellulophaga lytica]WQG77944.1 DUF2752 domain-containing protein [Cellulophaga lytica]SNQ43993.1 Conserved hypothetical membrane protein [Cellulophaga lytica]
MLLPRLEFNINDYMLPCMNKKFFGVDCPGCGIQRSISLILQGDFSGAFYMYPAIYSLILLFGFIGVNHFYKIKYANKIIISLLVINFVLVFTNYINKFI